jgi:hypothetical protein
LIALFFIYFSFPNLSYFFFLHHPITLSGEGGHVGSIPLPFCPFVWFGYGGHRDSIISSPGHGASYLAMYSTTERGAMHGAHIRVPLDEEEGSKRLDTRFFLIEMLLISVAHNATE